MIFTFNRVKDFMHMVDLQPERAKVISLVTNNSYTHVWELYFFDDILRGVKQKPMGYEVARWFGEGTTLTDIKSFNEILAIKIERNKWKLPQKKTTNL